MPSALRLIGQGLLVAADIQDSRSERHATEQWLIIRWRARRGEHGATRRSPSLRMWLWRDALNELKELK
jgi:hypothetical protein